MPATLAHYIFGQKCLKALPEDLANQIRKNIDYYDFGVHGPDIFFYYKPLRSNDINKYGSFIHHQPSYVLFNKFAKAYQSSERKDEALAYAMGFLTHFCLDSTAHKYIEEERKALGISHNKLESEYEAHLIRGMGKKPTAYDRSKVLSYSDDIAKLVTEFFDFDYETIRSCLKSQVTSIKLYYSPTGIKRKFLLALLSLLNGNSDFADLFTCNSEDQRCVKTNRQLDVFMEQSLAKFVSSYQNYLDFLRGKADYLDQTFADDFG
ncbi:MAG: zinc dependent phospholipase C family protein [Erysipelotrichaceae bacterium]|nr:zinc dependent phospholipase C family protein [Erysipelotrichaceae bacterium]